MKTLKITLIPAILLSYATFCLSYEIQPSFKFASSPVHETMTAMAVECLIKYKGNKPKNCLKNKDSININSYISLNPFVSSLTIGSATVADLQKAVQWSDDPTRSLSSEKSLIKSGFVIKKLCKKYKKDITSGLLCSSHYGPLQFLHAMSSTKDESNKETRNKMLDWSEFAFEIATGKVSLYEDYCSFLSSPNMGGLHVNINHKKTMASSLLPSNKKSFICTENKGKPWVLLNLFNFHCTNPLSSGKCDVNKAPREAQLSALASILHMVQDSFSQSHTNRSNIKKLVSTIKCSKITHFYSYTPRTEKEHKKSDQFPKIENCTLNSDIDDPVTASAKILWFATQGSESKTVRNYLDKFVF